MLPPDKVVRHIQNLVLINNHKFLYTKGFPSDAKANYLERDEEYIEKKLRSSSGRIYLQYTVIVTGLVERLSEIANLGQTTEGEHDKRHEHASNKRGHKNTPQMCEERLSLTGNEASVKAKHSNVPWQTLRAGKIKKAGDTKYEAGGALTPARGG